MKISKIAIACDHAGVELKKNLVKFIEEKGIAVQDFGCHSDASVDYPDFAHKVGEGVNTGEFELGFVVCGSGNGVNMCVNKYEGVRGALCWTDEISELARQHNNANVCAVPARFIPEEMAKAIVVKFLETPFEGGRHQKRVDKIAIAK